MLEIDQHQDQRHFHDGAAPPHDFLAAENVSLRLLLAQAEINAQELLDQAGIDARERAASDKLQKLILEELHHRIKNTLATVSAIASQSLRNVPGAEHAQHAIEGRLLALGRAHDLLLQARWSSADLGKIVRGATEAFDNPDAPKFSIAGPDVRMTSGAVIAIAMTLNELCTNTTKFGALSVPTGRVEIAWTLDPKTPDQKPQRLHLTWTGKNGPAVQPPEKRSFGTRLVETLSIQGRRTLDVRANWVRLRARRAACVTHVIAGGIADAPRATRRVERIEVENMTGEQSRGLKAGDRVCWGEDKNDQATVTKKNWSGMALKWDNRSEQPVLHNDMAIVFLIPKSRSR